MPAEVCIGLETVTVAEVVSFVDIVYEIFIVN